MKRKMVLGSWLFVVGLLLCVVLMFGFSCLAERGLNAIIGGAGIVCLVGGSELYTRSKFEGKPMEWSSLKSVGIYKIVFYCSEHAILCVDTSPEHFFEYRRFLKLPGAVCLPKGATHLRVLHLAKRDEIQFISVESERISELESISVCKG